jgi:hypothetical protein
MRGGCCSQVEACNDTQMGADSAHDIYLEYLEKRRPKKPPQKGAGSAGIPASANPKSRCDSGRAQAGKLNPGAELPSQMLP